MLSAVSASLLSIEAASAATPVCQFPESDESGDGWGWENNRSCRITSAALSASGTAKSRPSAKAGLVANTKPAVNYCTNRDSDLDGDGWGWENNRSCRVSTNSLSVFDTKKSTSSTIPGPVVSANRAVNYCDNRDSDPDGDGWGWENNRSCLVNEAGEDPATGRNNSSLYAAKAINSTKVGTPEVKTIKSKPVDPGSVIYSQDFSSASQGLYQGDQLHEQWDSPVWHMGFDEGRVKIITDDAAHGNVMQVTYPAGAYGSAGAPAFLVDVQFDSNSPKSYDELYLSYDIKFADNFEFVHGGKLPGLCGASIDQAPETGCNTGGGYPSGYDGWSTRGMWRQNGALENYVYHAGQTNYYGDDLFWGSNGSRGQWHRIQQRVVLNTPGVADGIIETWLDGKKVLSVTDMLYRKTGAIGINLFYFSTFYGGNDPSWAPSSDQTAFFDNFRISTQPAGF